MKKVFIYTFIIVALALMSCAHTPSGSPAAGIYRQGMTLFNSGQIDLAAIEFRKANAADPEYAPPYAMLGRVYLSKGDSYRAEMFFRKALALDPSETQIYGWIGDIYWQDGDHDKAMEYYGRCPEDNPHYAVLRFRLGMRAFQEGRLSEARDEFLRATKFPDYWGGYYGLGLLDCADGFYEQAIQNFSKVHKDSAECEIDYWLGKSYYHLDKRPQAYLHYRRYCCAADNCEMKNEAKALADQIEKVITEPDSGIIDTSLIIPFALKSVSDIAVGICDLDGKVVKYLFRGAITRGEYTLKWDGTTDGGQRATRGIYLGFVDCDEGLEVYPINLDK